MKATRWLAIFMFAGLVFPAASWSQGSDLKKALNQSKDLQSQGKIEEALPHAEKALALGKGVFGKGDPNVAILLDHVAALYKSLKNFEVAEGYYEQALTIREEALGSNHPDVAASYNRLAVLYHGEGKLFAAEFLYKRALNALKSAKGPEALKMAKYYNNLAVLYQD